MSDIFRALVEYGEPGSVAEYVGQLERQRDELLAELRNIADADPSTWEPDVRDQFRQWAQNRARTAIAKAKSHA
jgi:chromatin segregation and condensation protein Rec8/ScpA/Scc1 (kleisin family)